MPGVVRRGSWLFAAKAALADRVVLVAAAVVVLLAASVVAAVPIYANAVEEASLHGRLAKAPVRTANLQASVDYFGGGDGKALDERVRRLTREAFGRLPTSIFASAESEPFLVRGRVAVFGFIEGLPRHARLVSGHWPAGRRSPAAVAVSTAAAKTLGLALGEFVQARDRLDGHEVEARVVGLYRPLRPASVYWWGDPQPEGGSGPLVASRATFFALGLTSPELRWRISPDLRTLTVGEAGALRRRLEGLQKQLNAAQPSGQFLSLDTGLPGLIGGAQAALHDARAGVLVPSLQLLLLALYGLVFTAGLVVSRRAATVETLRLRGAGRSSAATVALAQSLLAAVPAVAAAPWLAAWALRALNVVGPLSGIGFHLEPRVDAVAYGLAAAAGGVCIAALVLPTLRARKLVAAGEQSRLPAAGFAQRARLDLVVAALALLSYWQLRRYHGVLVAHSGGLAIDPFLVAAPAVLLLAGGLLSLRLVPLAAAAFERLVASARGAVAPLALWQLERRPRRYAGCVLLLVLAVAIGVFAVAYAATWRGAQVDQAAYSAGGDVLVQPGYVAGGPPDIDLASTYRSLGALEALPAASDTFDVGQLGLTSGNLLALDARRASRVVHVRRGFAPQPLAQLLRPLAATRGRLASLPLPGRPARLALTVEARMSPPPHPHKLAVSTPYLPQPSLFLYLRDRDGVVYLDRLRPFALGHPQRFTFDLVHRRSGGRVSRPRYPLALVGVELDVAPPLVDSRPLTLVLRSLETSSGQSSPWQRVSLAAPWRATAVPFQGPYEASRVDAVSSHADSVRALLGSGSTTGFAGPSQSSPAFVLRPGHDAVPALLPVLASDATLQTVHARVGQVIHLALSNGAQAVRIVGSFHEFPTLDPDTPAVVADFQTYTALLFASQRTVVPPPSWWLRTDGGATLLAELRAPSLHTVSVVSRAEQQRVLLDDPIPLGVIGALALAFVVAAGFGVLGFAAAAAAAVRSRTLEFAVLRALGLRTSQLARWIGLESAVVAVLSLLSGTLLGLLVAWAVLPELDYGGSVALAVRIVVPWTSLGWLVLGLLVSLTVIAAVQIRLVRRLRVAPILRSSEGVVAA
jgi:FtsX-like permease family protein